MKKILFAGLLLAAACKVVKLPTPAVGSWYEPEVSRTVTGKAESFSASDSTYTMRTYDGWAMKIKAYRITWK